MSYLVEYYTEYNGRLYHPCGTDYTMLIKGLRTQRGAEQRAEMYKPDDCMYYELITYTNLYDRATYKVVKRMEYAVINMQ